MREPSAPQGPSPHDRQGSRERAARPAPDAAETLDRLKQRLEIETRRRQEAEAALQGSLAAARLAQVELSESEMDLRLLLGMVPDAVIVIDADGGIRSFNTGAERLFGY